MNRIRNLGLELAGRGEVKVRIHSKVGRGDKLYGMESDKTISLFFKLVGNYLSS